VRLAAATRKRASARDHSFTFVCEADDVCTAVARERVSARQGRPEADSAVQADANAVRLAAATRDRASALEEFFVDGQTTRLCSVPLWVRPALMASAHGRSGIVSVPGRDATRSN